MILLTKHADLSSCVRLFGPEPDTGRNRELILGLLKKLNLYQCTKMRNLAGNCAGAISISLLTNRFSSHLWYDWPSRQTRQFEARCCQYLPTPESPDVAGLQPLTVERRADLMVRRYRDCTHSFIIEESWSNTKFQSHSVVLS